MTFREIIEDHIKKRENHIALGVGLDDAYTFEQLAQFYDLFVEKMNELLIPRRARIAVLAEDALLIPFVAAPLVDHWCSIQFTINDSIEVNIDKIKHFKIDYILTNDHYYRLLSKVNEKLNFIIYNKFSISSVELTKIEKTKVFENGSNIAMVAESSGTTSNYKVIPYSFDKLITRYQTLVSSFRYDASRSRLQVAQLIRTNTSKTFLNMIYVGATSYFSNGVNFNLIYKMLQQKEPTDFRIAPSNLMGLLNFIDKHQLTLDKQPKYLLILGSYLSEDLYKQCQRIFNKSHIIHTYGATETTTICSNIDSPKGYIQDSVGQPMLHQIRIVDDEIQVKHESVFDGYEGIDNSEYFDDGWFKTGDLGYLKDGYLYITGRKKEVINKGGEKISPYELEKILLLDKRLREVVVFPYLKDNKHEHVAVAIVTCNDEKISIYEIRKLLMNKDIRAYKLPTRLYQVKSLPKSESAKIQRNKLFQYLSTIDITFEEI